jgi:hypothetical protein
MVSLDLKQAAPSRVCLIGGERLRGQGKVEEAYQLRHDSTKNRNTFYKHKKRISLSSTLSLSLNECQIMPLMTSRRKMQQFYFIFKFTTFLDFWTFGLFLLCLCFYLLDFFFSFFYPFFTYYIYFFLFFHF